MKYCQYCGFELLDSDALFCSECGKKLKKENSQYTQMQKAKKHSPKKSKFSKNKKSVHSGVLQQPDDNSKDNFALNQDEGYDGYYDDVLPSDERNQQEPIDKELIKKIVLLVAGVLVVLVICVVYMYLI